MSPLRANCPRIVPVRFVIPCILLRHSAAHKLRTFGFSAICNMLRLGATGRIGLSIWLSWFESRPRSQRDSCNALPFQELKCGGGKCSRCGCCEQAFGHTPAGPGPRRKRLSRLCGAAFLPDGLGDALRLARLAMGGLSKQRFELTVGCGLPL